MIHVHLGSRAREGAPNLRPSIAAWVGVVGLLAGCRSAPAPGPASLDVPTLAFVERGYAGSPLGGVARRIEADQLDSDPRNALLVRLEAEWIERGRDAVGVPLERAARLITARSGGEPIPARLRLGRDVRAVRGEELAAFESELARGTNGRVHGIASTTRALLAGATQAWELRGATRSGATELVVEVHRASDRGVEVALALSGEVVLERDAHPADEPVDATAREPWRELALLDAAIGTRLSLLFPGLVDGGTTSVLRVTVAIEPAREDAVFAEAVRAAHEEAATAAREFRERAHRVEEREKRERERRSALESLARADNRRSALVFLAGAARAELCGDLALVADDTVLAELVTALTRGAEADGDLARDEDALAWHLERGTWSFLITKLDGDAPVPSELRGLLVRHAGEVARSNGALADILAASASATDLARRLEDENRAMLEDAHPSARIRAFDWLVARGREPKGYDPLATGDERRAALDAAEETPR